MKCAQNYVFGILYGCHGNQARADQVILRRNSNFKQKIKNPET